MTGSAGWAVEVHHPINKGVLKLWPVDVDYIYSACSMSRLVLLLVVNSAAPGFNSQCSAPTCFVKSSSLSEKGIR